MVRTSIGMIPNSIEPGVCTLLPDVSSDVDRLWTPGSIFYSDVMLDLASGWVVDHQEIVMMPIMNVLIDVYIAEVMNEGFKVNVEETISMIEGRVRSFQLCQLVFVVCGPT